jgi:hypothetical protein
MGRLAGPARRAPSSATESAVERSAIARRQNTGLYEDVDVAGIIYCDEEEAKHLQYLDDATDRLEDGWVTSRSAAAWKGAHVALIIVSQGSVGSQIAFLGRAVSGRRSGTLKRELTVTRVHPLKPALPLADLRERLPARHQKVLDKECPMPQRAGEVVLAVLATLRPDLSTALARIQESEPPIRVEGPVGRVLTLVRDATGVALQMAGFDRSPLAEWEPPDDIERSRRSFLDDLPEGTCLEDDLVGHDAGQFRDWLEVDNVHHLGWRQYNKGRQALIIGNVNRKAAEKTLGVDLIYYHEHRRCFVLIQYKKLVRADNDWTYYPSGDHNLDGELKRMRKVEEVCAKSAVDADDFRLGASPCWIKLCRSEGTLCRTDELVPGMYLPRAYFEQLRARPYRLGSNGGVRFGYKTVPRYLDNTTFTQLVADGWVGSTGTGTDLVRKQIEASHVGSREIVFAAHIGEVPMKGERTYERKVGS